jgi:hypothetical protein
MQTRTEYNSAIILRLPIIGLVNLLTSISGMYENDFFN